ncbi:MAG: response regulator [Nitrospirales bacterium]
MMDSTEPNRRILIIDDNVAIHEDFKKVLCQGFDTSLLQETRGSLFDDAPEQQATEHFDVDCADQGQEGHRMVKKAAEQGRPYAVAFVDMRMPPGWDGVETIEHLWSVDDQLQIVICTAFSDHAWYQVFERLKHKDKLLILRKPFDNIEVWQLASSLTTRWNQFHQAKGQFDLMAQLADERAEEEQREAEQIRLMSMASPPTSSD